MKKRINDELEKNSNNLRWDYSCKLRGSKFVFESVYQEKIDHLAESIEDTVTKTLELRNDKKIKVEEQVNCLEKLKTQVYMIRKDMF